MSDSKKGTVEQFLEQMGVSEGDLPESSRRLLDPLYDFMDVSVDNARSGRTLAMALAVLKVAMDNPGHPVDLMDRHHPYSVVGSVVRGIVRGWPESTHRKFNVIFYTHPHRVCVIPKNG